MKTIGLSLLLAMCLCIVALGQSASLSPQFTSISIQPGGQYQNGVIVTFNDPLTNSVGLTGVSGCPDGATCTLLAFKQTPNAGLIGAKYPTSAGEAVLFQAGTAASGVYSITVVGIAQPSLVGLSETFTVEIQ